VQKSGYVVKEDRDGVKKEYSVFVLKNFQVDKKIETVNFGAEKSKLFPTDIGMVVTDFLLQHFVEIMDFNFTANVEKEFDEIAEGNIEWQKMISSFYTPFHIHVEETTQNSDRASGERLLGNDPKSGLPVFARIGRYGPLIQCLSSLKSIIECLRLVGVVVESTKVENGYIPLMAGAHHWSLLMTM
jgi:DNA topoisomerase-1